MAYELAYICDFCGTGNRSGEDIYTCNVKDAKHHDECGNYFCETCFKRRHGEAAWEKWRERHLDIEKVACPDCYANKNRGGT